MFQTGPWEAIAVLWKHFPHRGVERSASEGDNCPIPLSRGGCNLRYPEWDSNTPPR